MAGERSLPVGAGVTKREAEVLDLLSQRLSNGAIAAKLVISERTVESHVSSLLRKLGGTNRRQLTELAGRNDKSEGANLPRRSSVRFIGRGPEVQSLVDSLAETQTQGFRVALVVGEPGVGKTRLTDEFARVAKDDKGATVLAARAFALGSTTAMATWVDALESHLRSLDAAQLRRLCGPWLRDVVALVPRISELVGGHPAELPSQRQAVETLGHVLRRLASSSPVLVVLDDAHLADGSSWNALERLARDLADSPVLVVLTARPPELNDVALARDVLARLGDEVVVQRVAVPPLEAAQVEELARALVGPDGVGDSLVDWIMARSWGNPLYAIGLLRALVDEGADLSAPSLHALPEGLSERIRSRLARLDRSAAALLELLAVFGRAATAAEIVWTSDLLLPDLIAPLEALIDAGLVIERDRHGRDLTYDVTHPMVSQAVYHGTTGVRRRVYHRSIAKHLRATGRLAESSSHLARGADLGDAEAVDALQSALQEAGRLGAYPEAHAILGALANVLPPRDERWLRAFDALSDEAQWILDHRGDVDAEPCIRAMQAMDALLAGGGDLVRRGIVKLRLASLYSYGIGDTERAASVAADALSLFEVSGDKARALLAKIELAAHHNVVGDLRGLENAAALLLDEAEEIGDPLLLMHVTGWLALGRSFSGEFAEANQLFRRSTQIATENDESFHRTWSQSIHATNLTMQGDVNGALALVRQVEQEGARLGESIFHECASIPHWAAGQFAESLKHVESAVNWHQGRLAKRRGFALPFGAMAAAELGDPDTAQRLLRIARSLYRDANFVVHRDLTVWAESVAAGLDGDLQTALQHAMRASDALLQVRCRAYAGPALAEVAEIAADVGDPDAFLAAMNAFERLAAQLDDAPFNRGLALLVKSCAPQIGDAERLTAAAAGADLFIELGYDSYAGRASCRMGVALANLGESGRSEDAFAQAERLFVQCGAVVRAARAAELSRSCLR